MCVCRAVTLRGWLCGHTGGGRAHQALWAVGMLLQPRRNHILKAVSPQAGRSPAVAAVQEKQSGVS